MIDLRNFIDKVFDCVKILLNDLIATLDQGNFFFELHGSHMRPTCIQSEKFFPLLVRGFYGGDEGCDRVKGVSQNGTEDEFVL